MNRERAKELLPIIEAFINGAEIEWFNDWPGNEGWTTFSEGNFDPCDNMKYRIKPSPREFEIMVMVNGRIRDPVIDVSGYSGEVIKVREVLE